MKNKETPFCEPAQRTKPYVTGEQKGVDTVIRYLRLLFCAEDTVTGIPQPRQNVAVLVELAVERRYVNFDVGMF